ncbi:MAG: hypothetical protein JXA43_03690 [Candidatus Diapherotrites archaeon]|nr:hypothetical protein [Candidatus Diapherotrites archaeon]
MRSVSGSGFSFPAGLTNSPSFSGRVLAAERASHSIGLKLDEVFPFQYSTVNSDHLSNSEILKELKDTFGVSADEIIDIDEALGIVTQMHIIDDLKAKWMTDTTINYDKNFQPLKEEFELLEETINELDFEDFSEFSIWFEKKKKSLTDIEAKRKFFESHTIKPKDT